MYQRIDLKGSLESHFILGVSEKSGTEISGLVDKLKKVKHIRVDYEADYGEIVCRHFGKKGPKNRVEKQIKAILAQM